MEIAPTNTFKIQIAALGLGAALLSSLCVAQDPLVEGFLNGNRLLEFSQAGNLHYVTAYVVGVVDSTHLVDSYSKGRTICEPPGVTQHQLREVVIKYLHDHPATRHLNAAELVVMAVKDAFPCARSR